MLWSKIHPSKYLLSDQSSSSQSDKWLDDDYMTMWQRLYLLWIKIHPAPQVTNCLCSSHRYRAHAALQYDKWCGGEGGMAHDGRSKRNRKYKYKYKSNTKPSSMTNDVGGGANMGRDGRSNINCAQFVQVRGLLTCHKLQSCMIAHRTNCPYYI